MTPSSHRELGVVLTKERRGMSLMDSRVNGGPGHIRAFTEEEIGAMARAVSRLFERWSLSKTEAAALLSVDALAEGSGAPAVVPADAACREPGAVEFAGCRRVTAAYSQRPSAGLCVGPVAECGVRWSRRARGAPRQRLSDHVGNMRLRPNLAALIKRDHNPPPKLHSTRPSANGA
jgi:hypothetical protein